MSATDFRAAVFRTKVFARVAQQAPIAASAQDSLAIMTGSKEEIEFGAGTVLLERPVELDLIDVDAAQAALMIFEAIGWARKGIACGYLPEDWGLSALIDQSPELAEVVAMEQEFDGALGTRGDESWETSKAEFAAELTDCLAARDDAFWTYLRSVYLVPDSLWAQQVDDAEGFIAAVNARPDVQLDDAVVDGQLWYLQSDEWLYPEATPAGWLARWHHANAGLVGEVTLGTKYVRRLRDRLAKVESFRRRLSTALLSMTADSSVAESVKLRSAIEKLAAEPGALEKAAIASAAEDAIYAKERTVLIRRPPPPAPQPPREKGRNDPETSA